MILHLIRHAQAEERGDEKADARRALTARGHAQVEHLARALSRLDVHYDAIISSPLVRAKETARGLQGLASRLEESELLVVSPGQALLVALQSRAVAGSEALGLVGHEPFLSERSRMRSVSSFVRLRCTRWNSGRKTS
jgi:phosphohistidine phosphatase